MTPLILLAITCIGFPSALAYRRGGGGNGSGGTSPLTEAGRGVFQAAACPFRLGAGIVEGQQVTCGYLTVSENRLADRGQDIKLAVAIWHAPQYMNVKDPSPVLWLEGGPGGSALDDLNGTSAQNLIRTVFNHDLILFDQRGAGYSLPALNCPEAAVSQALAAYRRCYDRLTAAGIDLDGFNTIQNAADVADLIHALGYQQMTLYGVSYGTRLALTVLRLYPSVVRAAVLDSVDPTTTKGNNSAANTQRVFDVLFRGCAENATCNAKYPDLKRVFYDLVDQLNASPASFTYTDTATQKSQSASLTGDGLISWLLYAFYRVDLIPLLPKLIYQLKAHDYTQFASLYQLVQNQFVSISWGLFYSAACSEDWPFVSLQNLYNSLVGIMPQIKRVMNGLGSIGICQFWKVQQVPTEQKLPVYSNIPTLVLSGEYDPVTPPASGWQVAQDLSNSYYFLFPGQTHGEIGSDCANQIISAFENNPEQRPSDACIAQMAEPAFQ